MTEFLSGWTKDIFDKHDYLHRRGVYPLPDKFSNAQYLTDVRNQGQVPSCVGFGIGVNLNHVKKKLGIFIEWASPTYIYNGARFLEGTLPLAVGCRPRNALEWTLDYGILDEHFWPYDDRQIDQRAPSWAIDDANRYIGFQYFRCVDGVDGLCDAISNGYFVSIGSPWFNEWRASPDCGRLPVPTNNSTVSGGHETCFFGYDRNEGVFFGQNSWGITWGDHGRYIMPFESIEIFKNRGGYDAHYLTYTSRIDTNPPPAPSPSPCPWGKGFANFLNAGLTLAGRKGRFVYQNRN